MCEIRETASEHKVGYKVLAMKDGEFYSTFTSQKISVGPVPELNPELPYKTLSGCWNSDVSYMKAIKWGFYRPNFMGKTSAFLDKSPADQLADKVNNMLIDCSYRVVVVKMTFEGVTYDGAYTVHDDFTGAGIYPCIAGNIIKSIEVV